MRSAGLVRASRAFSCSARIRSSSEVAHFAQLADSWWDPNGPQRILHKMNLMRMDFIRDVLTKYNAPDLPGYSIDLLPESMRKNFDRTPRNIDVLDVGCGGGLLSESLARLSNVKSVLGIDITPEVIDVARKHAELDPALTKLRYERTPVEQVSGSFDLVTMFEVIEHLDNPSATLRAALDKVRPGGWVFMSTINRTVLSYLTTIVAAEDLLRIVPKGTHTWSKYVNEEELREWFHEQPDWQFVCSEGCIYIPTQGWERFGRNTDGILGDMLNGTIGKTGGNYLLAAKKV